jgi:hypothetical protein
MKHALDHHLILMQPHKNRTELVFISSCSRTRIGLNWSSSGTTGSAGAAPSAAWPRRDCRHGHCSRRDCQHGTTVGMACTGTTARAARLVTWVRLLARPQASAQAHGLRRGVSISDVRASGAALARGRDTKAGTNSGARARSSGAPPDMVERLRDSTDIRSKKIYRSIA